MLRQHIAAGSDLSLLPFLQLLLHSLHLHSECHGLPPRVQIPPERYSLGCGVQGSGIRVQGSGFRAQGSEFRAQGRGFMVHGSGPPPSVIAWGSGPMAQDLGGLRVHGLRLRVQGLPRSAGARRPRTRRAPTPEGCWVLDAGFRV